MHAHPKDFSYVWNEKKTIHVAFRKVKYMINLTMTGTYGALLPRHVIV